MESSDAKEARSFGFHVYRFLSVFALLAWLLAQDYFLFGLHNRRQSLEKKLNLTDKDFKKFYLPYQISGVIGIVIFPILLDVFKPSMVLLVFSIIQANAAILFGVSVKVKYLAFSATLFGLFSGIGYSSVFKAISVWFTKEHYYLAFGGLFFFERLVLANFYGIPKLDIVTLLDKHEWNLIFFIAAGLLIIATISFYLSDVPEGHEYMTVNPEEETPFSIFEEKPEHPTAMWRLKQCNKKIAEALKSKNFYLPIVYITILLSLCFEMQSTIFNQASSRFSSKQFTTVRLLSYGGTISGVIVFSLLCNYIRMKHFILLAIDILDLIVFGAFIGIGDKNNIIVWEVFAYFLSFFTIAQICIVIPLIAKNFDLSVVSFVVAAPLLLTSIIRIVVSYGRTAIAPKIKTSDEWKKLIALNFGPEIGGIFIMCVLAFFVREEKKINEYSSEYSMASSII